PHRLVVGGVELGLIHVEPHARALGGPGPRRVGLLGERGGADRRHGAGRRAQNTPASEPITGLSQSADGAAPTGAPPRTRRRPAAPSGPRTGGRRSAAPPASRPV